VLSGGKIPQVVMRIDYHCIVKRAVTPESADAVVSPAFLGGARRGVTSSLN
jgi:hypothetical protein